MRILKTSIAIAVMLFGWFAPARAQVTSSAVSFGPRVGIGSTATLVGDLRYVFLDYNFDAVPGSSEIDDDFYTATAGLLFNI